jgi:hypothetical protein
MSGLRVAAILLVLAGIAALVYGGFSYTKTTHEVTVGRFDLGVKEKRRVNVPIWAGIAAIVAGAGLALVPSRA